LVVNPAPFAACRPDQGAIDLGKAVLEAPLQAGIDLILADDGTVFLFD
jgi:hypothetical protein